MNRNNLNTSAFYRGGKSRICLMSGAVVNAGDFLIEKRALALIRHFIPESEVTVFNRVNKDYSDRIDELNSFGAIIFAGGPLYQPGLYPKSIPFVNPELLDDVKTPLFFLGGGLHTNYYRCSYSPLDKKFFDRGIHGAESLSSRDIFTYKFLKHEGYPATLTGCPAWYDLDFVDKAELTKQPEQIKKICVSEPADPLNVPLLTELLIHLRARYKDADITLVNHREIKKGIELLRKVLEEKYGIKIVNIAGSVDGFSIYNDCDLHVGFRVHAHIYNLSRRNLTVLFNEDIRGVGVNTTLGLDCLNIEQPAFGKKKLFGRYYLIRYSESDWNTKDVAGWMFDEYMDSAIENGFQNYRKAFRQMRQYFQNMSSFFDIIKARL